MVISHSLGHKIIYQSGSWLYKDGGRVEDNPRPCIKCEKYPTKEGHDACLRKFTEISTISSACCGHGIEKGFMLIN